MNKNVSNYILHCRGITKAFAQGISDIKVLRGIDLNVMTGESIAIVGASGAGKSTLLHILGSLDNADGGELWMLNQNLSHLNDDALSAFRNQNIGFVFQFHHLLAEFTALENVILPCLVGKTDRDSATLKATQLLTKVGLGQRLHHFPSELSGGELQRVAIARALVNGPKILFADEPTGNLDSKNSQLIQELFFNLKSELGLTLIVVTHDIQFAKKFNRTLIIKDGLWSAQ
jgi:lipoprotein-releasing system ATP-binding protein